MEPPRAALQWIAPLSSKLVEDAKFAGRKAANLSILLRSGFRVPEGIAISGRAFVEFLTLNRIDSSAPEAQRQVREAREWPQGLKDQVSEFLQDCSTKFGGTVLFAVRSSGMEEDSPIQAFAGMHDSLLNTKPEAVFEALKTCWSSSFNNRKVSYTNQKLMINFPAPPFGVVIQRMIIDNVAPVAGVAFTCDPITGSDAQIVIECAAASGERVVSGSVTPDRFLVPKNAPDNTIISESFSIISKSMLVEMATVFMRVEALFGSPQDIEWCLENHNGDTQPKLWLLQARPITTLATQYKNHHHSLSNNPKVSTANSNNNNDVLSNLHTMESMSFIPTALTWSTFSEVIDTALARRYRCKGIDYDSLRGNRSFYELCQGHVYQNVSLTCELNLAEFGIAFDETSREFHLPAKARAALMRDSTQTSASVLGKVSGTISLLKTLFNAGDVVESASVMIPRELERCLGLRAELKASLPTLNDAAKALQILESLLENFKDLAETYIDVTIHSAIFQAAVSSMIGRERAPQIAKLISHLGGVFTLQQALEMRNLTQSFAAVANDPGSTEQLIRLLKSANTSSTGPGISSQISSLAGSIAEFLEKYGFRSEVELEVSAPRWWDSPETFVEMLKALQVSSEDQLVATPHEREATEQIIQNSASVLTRPLLRWAVKQLQSLMRLRENGKSLVVFYIGLARMIILALARLLVESGSIAADDDIFHFSLQDIRILLSKPNSVDDLRACCAANRALHRRWQHSQFHSCVIGSSPCVAAQNENTSLASNDGLKGIAASPGCIQGVARVILLDAVSTELEGGFSSIYSHPEVLCFKEGEILVTRTTNPSWTPLLVKCSAVVVEFGGLLSHGAITARELGVPAVVAVANFGRIKTGDRLIVDGSTGLVTILPPEN